jgi:hypothetical protein
VKRVVLLFVCFAIMPPAAQAGELFRWVDANGKVHYGDVRPPDATDVESLKLSSEPAQNEDLPYETRRAQQNFPVTLYVGKGCGDACDMARGLLTRRGIPFTEKLLQYKEDFEAFKKLSGFDGVPTLSVGKTFLRGFLAEQWHSELDIAGYPKSAPYRPSNAISSSPAASQVAPVNSPANPAAQ